MSKRRARLVVAFAALAAICYAVAELHHANLEKAITARP